jgi:glycosyl transferase family 87
LRVTRNAHFWLEKERVARLLQELATEKRYNFLTGQIISIRGPLPQRTTDNASHPTAIPHAILRFVSGRAFAILILAALATRLILIATTFGTTDALLLMMWTHIAERFGIGGAYQFTAGLNHPPLALVLLRLIDALGGRIGLEFPDIFRLVQVAADLATGALIYVLARREQPQRAREFAAFFFASPAAIFLSGFHCNSDPTMMMLLTGAVLFSSGALFGLASGIKIAPLPLAPFFLIDMTWRRRVQFVITAAAVLALIFLPAVSTGGTIVLRNVFGYTGSGYEWGFCGIGYLTGVFGWARFYAQYGRYVVIAALAVLWLLFYRRRATLPVMIATALLAMNFFSPAFGVQYLVWPLPLLLFALPRPLAYAVNAALSAFLFATYTIWSREFPWWFANAAGPNPLRPLVALLAVPLWVLYGWAIVAAVRGNGQRDRGQKSESDTDPKRERPVFD